MELTLYGASRPQRSRRPVDGETGLIVLITIRVVIPGIDIDAMMLPRPRIGRPTTDAAGCVRTGQRAAFGGF
jgi:hypothetical protein